MTSQLVCKVIYIVSVSSLIVTFPVLDISKAVM